MCLGRYARLKEQEEGRIIEKKMFTKQTDKKVSMAEPVLRKHSMKLVDPVVCFLCGGVCFALMEPIAGCDTC